MQFRVILVTHPPTNPTRPFQTDRTDYNTLRRSLGRSVNIRLAFCRHGVVASGSTVSRITDGVDVVSYIIIAYN